MCCLQYRMSQLSYTVSFKKASFFTINMMLNIVIPMKCFVFFTLMEVILLDYAIKYSSSKFNIKDNSIRSKENNLVNYYVTPFASLGSMNY